MGSKHKRLVGLEETRLLRDFEKHGFDPQIYHGPESTGLLEHGWVCFSPSDANAIYECLEELRLTL